MEEKNIKIKQTFSNMIKEELPEMTQEEAIKNYREDDTIKPINNTKKDNDNDDNTEESDHLKRIKQELLASLERVKQLAKRLYSEEKTKSKLKVKEKVEKQQAKRIDKIENKEDKKEQDIERE